MSFYIILSGVILAIIMGALAFHPLLTLPMWILSSIIFPKLMTHIKKSPFFGIIFIILLLITNYILVPYLSGEDNLPVLVDYNSFSFDGVSNAIIAGLAITTPLYLIISIYIVLRNYWKSDEYKNSKNS